MNKTYISSLLVVLMVGAQAIRAQEDLDDAVFAELNAEAAGSTQAASVESSEGRQKALMSKGIELYEAGDYDAARGVFEAVLANDQYDQKAMSYLQRTAAQISAKEKRKLEAVRDQAMSEVAAKWNPDFQGAIAEVEMAPEKEKSGADIAAEAMTQRLKSIRIPSLDFREANIQDVILYLTETSRRTDPSRKGVNMILLGVGAGTELGNDITISVQDASLYDALQYVTEMASMKFEVGANVVTISPVNYIRNVDIVVQSFVVIPEVGDELESMGGGGESAGGMEDLFGDTGAAATESTGPVDVTEYFSVVNWSDDSQATYYPTFHKLVVKNTPDNIKVVKGVLDDLEDEAIKKRSMQVMIEAKFVEFSEGALEELGFDWNVYGSGSLAGFDLVSGRTYTPRSGYASPSTTTIAGGATAATTPIFTDPASGYTVVNQGTDAKPGESIFGGNQRNNASAFESITSGILSTMGGNPAQMFFTNGDVDLRLTAMQQEGTADVLSAPRVTTKSGVLAKIRVVEVHRYPQGWSVDTGQRTAPVVTPEDWEDFDLGVVLDVQPDVDPESNTIDLQLTPEIKKFKGFEDYAVAVNAYISDDLGGTTVYGEGNQLFARMPYFETRTVDTQVTVADGSTVIMGGLVDERTETFRDQVPILGDIPYIGRLFRTEGTRSAKKNLVIFVKATQVDEHGMSRAQRELARQASAQ